MERRAPRHLAISDRRALRGESLADWARRLAAAGVDALQIREKDLDDRSLFELVVGVRRAAPTTTLLVNGRADIARAARADGVHLPASGLPAATLRRRFGPGLLIGRSTHRPEEIEVARGEGVDYVTFGPVYPTPSKAAWGPPPGPEGLAEACRRGLPVLALGGVTIGRLPELAAAGAAGAAGIRTFLEPAAALELIAAASRVFEAP